MLSLVVAEPLMCFLNFFMNEIIRDFFLIVSYHLHFNYYLRIPMRIIVLLPLKRGPI